MSLEQRLGRQETRVNDCEIKGFEQGQDIYKNAKELPKFENFLNDLQRT